jgi:phosphatidate cytidylyltransferase
LAHARADLVAATAGSRWSDFSVRLASAAILGPAALFCVWQGGIAWQILIYATLIGLGLEWARLAGLKLAVWPAALLAPGVMICAGIAVALGWPAGFAALAALTLLTAITCGRFAAAGVPYAGVAGLALLWMRLAPNGLRDTLFLVAVIWATDIGAYLVGRVIGGRKLAPAISPGKTWSGAAGGLVFAAAAGFCLGDFRWGALPAAVLLSVFAQAGDLLESAVKRRVGVKDSGHTIPGHGGLFDRLDGFLAAAPVAAVLALVTQGGSPLWH